MEEEKVKKLIEDSGIITHYKVIDILRKKDWNLSISPYYYDNIANTIKEIDLVAEKPFSSYERFDQSSVQINVQLFIECKYIKQEIIFWFDLIDKDKAVSKIEQETGLEISYGAKRWADIGPEKFHYLNNEKVAKLFSTNTNKEDVIYKALSQCLHAKIYYDQWFDKPIYKQFREGPRVTTSILKYPVIICDNFSKLKEVKFSNDNGHEQKDIQNYFQLEIDYTYLDRQRITAKTDYFLIDVVNINHLSTFLDGLEIEMKSLINAYTSKKI